MGYLDDAVNWLGRNVDPRQIVAGGNAVGNFFDPARPYNQQAKGLQQGSEDAKALAALQWQREMQGLSQALGYGRQAQGAINSVYASHPPALPVGMTPPAPPPAVPAVPAGFPYDPAKGQGLAQYMSGKGPAR